MYRWFWFLVRRRSGLIHPRRELRFLKLSVSWTWQLRRACCRKAFRVFLKGFSRGTLHLCEQLTGRAVATLNGAVDRAVGPLKIGRFAGEEERAVEGFGENLRSLEATYARIAVGPARERIRAPVMKMKLSQQRIDFGNRNSEGH